MPEEGSARLEMPRQSSSRSRLCTACCGSKVGARVGSRCGRGMGRIAGAGVVCVVRGDGGVGGGR